MKKYNSLLLFAGLMVLCAIAAYFSPLVSLGGMFLGTAIVPRGWYNLPKDNTSRTMTNAFTEPAYAATITVVPNASRTFVKPAALTGNLTLNVTTTYCKDLDELEIMLTNSSTKRVVTLGAKFLGDNSLLLLNAFNVPASKSAIVKAIYDATLDKFRVQSVIVEGKGLRHESAAYAATIAITATSGKKHLITPAQLTGALTLNATDVSAYDLDDEFIFHFSTDGTQRIVTFGTNILSSGTLTIPAGKTATARGWFNGTNICIMSREISA